MRIQKGIASASLLAGKQSLFRIHSATARHEQDTKCLRMASRRLKAKGMKEDIESTVNQYVDSVVNSEMKKEFMRYVTLENSKTTLGK